jgi:hypothetical protein
MMDSQSCDWGAKVPHRTVVAQSDAYAGTVSPLVVAEVTKNRTVASDPACLFIAQARLTEGLQV